MAPSAPSSPAELAAAWREPLLQLHARIRASTRRALEEALDKGALDDLGAPVSMGAGDTTFALDLGPEQVVADWLAEQAERGPLSLFSEDTGWTHAGPPAAGDDPFDHGGPRIVVDPVDGTRNLMHDLRSAWTVVSLCAPGSGQPRYSDLVVGLVGELPDSRSAVARRLWAWRGGGCWYSTLNLRSGEVSEEVRLYTDAEARVDHGYFSFFSYHPAQRPPTAGIAHAFFQRLAEHEGADLDHCYDDQYISSGGQLVLLAMGSYRMAVDLRGRLARARTVAKAYDMAGAALCAVEAGVVVERPEGGPLDFPFDAETAVDFVGYANRATAERLGPHLHAALVASGE